MSGGFFGASFSFQSCCVVLRFGGGLPGVILYAEVLRLRRPFFPNMLLPLLCPCTEVGPVLLCRSFTLPSSRFRYGMCGDLVRFGDLPGFSIDMVPLLLQLRNCTVCFFLFALLLPTRAPDIMPSMISPARSGSCTRVRFRSGRWGCGVGCKSAGIWCWKYPWSKYSIKSSASICRRALSIPATPPEWINSIAGLP